MDLAAPRVEQVDLECTTIVMRGLNRQVTADMMKALLDETAGRSPARYDYIYVPWTSDGSCNIGLAFVNFEEPRACQEYLMSLRQHVRLNRLGVYHVRSVARAAIQGRGANLAAMIRKRGRQALDGHDAPAMFQGEQREGVYEVISRDYPSLLALIDLHSPKAGGAREVPALASSWSSAPPPDNASFRFNVRSEPAPKMYSSQMYSPMPHGVAVAPGCWGADAQVEVTNHLQVHTTSFATTPMQGPPPRLHQSSGAGGGPQAGQPCQQFGLLLGPFNQSGGCQQQQQQLLPQQLPAQPAQLQHGLLLPPPAQQQQQEYELRAQLPHFVGGHPAGAAPLMPANQANVHQGVDAATSVPTVASWARTRVITRTEEAASPPASRLVIDL